ncbi:sacsin N-terminal ATP-binding-like domain-containing protein [Angustibacter sp. McL0619]|uniref:sacsin N-terminal ATP-binding-like domain-containing protein n=1 Tax=Angustibacter sp. McL0619 TaxID=3415676 RepID=UPI003CE800AB
MTDPFGTAGIRQRVLAAWTAAPVRLREDANTEEDLALGGYRDRLLVELAQNAADAATRAEVPGRLLLTLRERPDQPPVLIAANTGEPLTAAGVQSLATLRASAKSADDDSVGRFGVGFAAVLAVSDEPAVLSRTGGVRFSRQDTAALVATAGQDTPALADEVRRREGHVPVLRLPFEADGTPPDGFDTAVVLALRDEVAADAVRAQLATLDDALLLALPALTEVVLDVDGRRRALSGAEQRWHVHRRAGTWTASDRAALLADRPTEERRQLGWQVLWAVPREPEVVVPGTVHAPTPTDEPLALPALLLASLPLDPTRRHVAPGPLADRLVAECARGYADLLSELALRRSRVEVELEVLRLVPVGLPAGALDGRLREQILTCLAGAEILAGVEDGRPLRPRDAVVLDVDADPGALEVLAPRLAGLVEAPSWGRSALRALDVPVMALADVVETLPAQGDPASWRTLYEGLSSLAVDARAREAMAALPVPLADGRVVRGARGLLLGESGQLPEQALQPLARFGLRVVHPDAAHVLLERLGARPATARAVLDDPAVGVAVQALSDALSGDGALVDNGGDALAVTDAVLALVAAAVAGQGIAPGELAWLRDLPLPDDDGELAPAAVLALPGSAAAELLDPDAIGLLGAEVTAAWSPAVLTAVGVLDGLGTWSAQEPDLHDPPDELAELDGFEQWADEVLGRGVVAGDVVAVRDLDAVLEQAWPAAVRHLAGNPELRRALLTPVRLRTSDGAATFPSYTAWWLGHELGLTGTVAPGSDDLDGVLDAAPDWVEGLDPQVQAALGVVDPASSLPLDEEVVARLVGAIGDPQRELGVPSCLRLWSWLASAGRFEVPVPQRVRVLDRTGEGTRLVDREDAVVADDPRWLQRADVGGLVVAPSGRAHELAGLLDLDLSSERAVGAVSSPGLAADVPAVARLAVPTVPPTWVEHEVLTVDGQEVDWWVDDAGRPHASTSDGLARALAWTSGTWPARHLLAEVLADPGSLGRRLAEDL